MKALLIAGPTASGKSALALAAARARGAAIVNADSMQVYRDLRVLTARPSADDEALVPHHLYGSVDAAENYSAGTWLRDAEAVLRAMDGRPVIFAGGTGLYFKALTRGLSNVPEIPNAIRDDVRSRLARDGAAALHATLACCDPDAAARLSINDGVRIARALEVVEATGRTLRDWQAERTPALLAEGSYEAVFLTLDRDTLYRRIDVRFDAMLSGGALDEVAALRTRRLDPLLPAMKAHGVPALIRHLDGDLLLEEAATIGKADTRHYAKRQFTWFRHQLPEFEWMGAEEAARKLSE